MESSRPGIIYWLMSTGVVLTSLPNSEKSFDSHAKYKRVGKPWIPLGAVQWRLHPEGEWREIADLPPEWGVKPVGGGLVEDDEADEQEQRLAAERAWKRRRGNATH